ncbi:FAD-dependent monooxygenase [Amycolatopsis pithecellobii]|uniref:FAD-dependent oxidoreductase n=1 Tax=Amycolatopsis pithecellobii TaxID=664692 RepID=A0A6N7Z085_9PSEU|nr:FAD-dependent monooxygenase [Amycolatopsis pithecellobii]MTD52824.1 FAD-dependent oxidoreductase [Amycolatopsis pithecellobii]
MRNILISGASIAGPALALWLNRYGFTTTVVEKAPALRDGGQAVDFRGNQLDVLRRSGLLDEVRRHQTNMGPQAVLDERGRQVASIPAEFMSGEVEILRGDLSRILFDATKDRTEYVFGDRITSLTEVADGVEVRFAHGGPRKFDLVIGADGLHSGVRALAFGPESRFRTDTGVHFAGFTAPNHLGLDRSGLLYNVPGRGVMLQSKHGGAQANVGLWFRAERLPAARRDVREILHEQFRDVGWEMPALLAALDEADDLFADSLCQVHLDHYTRGRIALVGDAAWGAGPGGGGTGLAMMTAYVLAGELAAAEGDHRIAFPAYEREVRGAAEAGLKQARGAGGFLVPATSAAIRRRILTYRLLCARPLFRLFLKLAVKAANVLTLKDYPAATSGGLRTRR